MEFKRLTMEDVPLVAAVIRDAFAGPPWGEDWNDAQRLTQYVREGMDGENALAFGLADGEGLARWQLGPCAALAQTVSNISSRISVSASAVRDRAAARADDGGENACRRSGDRQRSVCARGATLAPIISTKNRDSPCRKKTCILRRSCERRGCNDRFGFRRRLSFDGACRRARSVCRSGCLLPFAWLDHPAQKIMLVAMRTECVEHE